MIGATTTEAGLKVLCELDQNRYPKGITVSDVEMAALLGRAIAIGALDRRDGHAIVDDVQARRVDTIAGKVIGHILRG